MSITCNIASALIETAARQPDAIAIRCPGGGRGKDGQRLFDLVLTYRELDARSNAIASGLAAIGIGRGVRCALMVRPSLELFLLMFALFKAGAVPVLIDPGIRKRALKQCLAEAAPAGFVGIAVAQLARLLFGWGRGSVRHVVTVGRMALFGGTTLAKVEARGEAEPRATVATLPDEVAALLFTSGSTGVPKGVVYRHRHFAAQVELLRSAFGIAPGGIDLPTFPPFALFDPALGLTSVIPDMDPTRPGAADPRRLVATIERFGINQMFGSPALVDVLSRYGEAHGARLPTLTRVICAGAPVPTAVVARMQAMLDSTAQIWTPYGATECLPVAVIEGRDLRETRIATEAGAGTCVGRPLPQNRVRIIAIVDAPIADWSAARELPVGEVGEISVTGPSATDEYFHRPQATAMAKIRERMPDGSERIVHRMGDLGWIDTHGRLWFCGRMSQRVITAQGVLFTEQVESVFNLHPRVRRTALVGVGSANAQTPVLCIELVPGVRRREHDSIFSELQSLGMRHAHTAKVRHFLMHRGFPVDIRHNAKIGRERLAVWAGRKLGV